MENAEAFRIDLGNWLSEIIVSEKPNDKISAFRFGLGEIEDGYMLYLAGSNHYDETDDEWAAYPPEFVAAKELIISATESEKWYWILLEVIYSLGRALRCVPISEYFLGGDIPIFTGFESGDLYRLK